MITTNDYAIISRGIVEKISDRYFCPTFSKCFLRNFKRFCKGRMQLLHGDIIYDDGKFIYVNNIDIRFNSCGVVFQNGSKSELVKDCPAIIDITDYVGHMHPKYKYKYKIVLGAILFFKGIILYKKKRIDSEKDLSAIIGV